MPAVEDFREIVVVDYDAAWPALFEEEKARIVEALAEVVDGVVAIEHVGSTAVRGLAAKPIIDIVVGLRDLADGERCIRPLEAIGYEYRGEAGIPGRLFFRKGDPRSHHLHLVCHRSDRWEEHVLFRDYLRAHPDAAQEYKVLKRDLAEKYRADPAAYTDAKASFIESALAQAREDRRP